MTRILPGLSVAVALAAGATVQAQEADAPDPPPLYDTLRSGDLTPAGRIRASRLDVDRFAFTFDDGELFVLAPDDAPAVAVYLGDGALRVLPPDGPEHHQLERLSDEHLIEDEFERAVFWLTGDLGAHLVALADGSTGGDLDDAADLLENRRDALREDRLANPDGRVLADLWDTRAGLPPAAAYFYAEVDGDEHDWLSLEVDPHRREEMAVLRWDGRRRGLEVWLAANALGAAERPDAFPRDPDAEGGLDGDDDDWDFRDFGLGARPWTPPGDEPWTPRARVLRTDVDLALEGDGDATATSALLIEAIEPLASVRLQISPLAEVTEVRWRTDVPATAEDVDADPLLAAMPTAPDEPAPLEGTALPFVQDEHDRRIGDDLWEPWITVLLPRTLAAGERVILEVSYEGELVEQLQNTRDFLLRDTVNWLPRHPDAHLTRFDLTFRVPERYRVTSGGRLAGERVEDGTRILRWVTASPVRALMAFHYGQFDVETVDAPGVPPIQVWANRNRLGFAPGNRQQTLETLTGALDTFSDLFGPYAFDTLTVTETPSYGAQAFPGLVLLSFQAFGELNATAAAYLRAHEVAHQWWGTLVGWRDYRDQWISESFANYAAALYVLDGRGEAGEFAEIVDTWRRDLTGEVTLAIGQGRAYYGMSAARVRESDGHEAGPLVTGYRLASNEKPMEWELIGYEKGAMVLHMLRAMLSDPGTGDDVRFRALLGDFARAHQNGEASTDAFEAAVTGAFGEPMDWFFDQWVYGWWVPRYRPDLRVVDTGDPAAPFALRGRVTQEDVFDGFRMPVPVALDYADGRVETHVIEVVGDGVEVDIPLGARPGAVRFNPGNAVLARVN
jgi:hypothetical protein